MANTLKYNRETALNRAMMLFWEKGFYATSTRDLQQQLDMRPGSIYAAFGSKEGLYKESLQHYAHGMHQQLMEHIAAADTILGGLEVFVYEVLIDKRSELGNDICLMVRTLTEIEPNKPDLRKATETMMHEVEQGLAALFANAINNGELQTDAKPIELARLFQVLVSGIRSYMTHCNDNATIARLIEQMFVSLRAV